MEETLERLAFDLSMRALERQERVVEELRARTGTLLAAGAFVASLLGIRGSGVLAVAGAVSAVATICVGVSILLPNRVDLGIRETYRALAYWNDSVWDVNERIIARLTTRFEVACACLVLAIALWSLGLAVD